MRSIPDSIRNLLADLNLFKSSSRTIEVLQRQRVVTRVFLVCLALALATSSIYTFVSTQTKVITVVNPSRTDYESLWRNHSDSLYCRCSQISIPYMAFIQIVPTFHQLCSSQIISPEWYHALTAVIREESYGNSVEFRTALGANYFKTLALFCSLAQNTVADAYRVFSNKAFINNRVLPETLFSQQVENLINLFIKSTKSEFMRTFTLERSMIDTSQLASRTFSNFAVDVIDNSRLSMTATVKGFISTNPDDPMVGICSCLVQDDTCGNHAFSYDFNSSTGSDFITLPNLVIKCIPTESTLSSTLECWYDSFCFTFVRNGYIAKGVVGINGILSLNTDIPSRFAREATMKMMMDELLIENWTIHTSYDQFYNICAPASCMYTIQQRFDWFFVIVTILGVYGGLNKTLRLIVPVIVPLILIILKRIQNRLNNRATHSVEDIQPDGE